MLQPPELAAAPTRTQDDLAEPESDGGFGGAEFFSAEIRPFRPKFEFVTVETGDPFFKTSKLLATNPGGTWLNIETALLKFRDRLVYEL